MTSVLFTHATVLTMDRSQPLLTDAFVSVDGPKITFIGQQRPFGRYDREIDCTGKVLMPGLINAHTHLPMTLMRGYGGGHNLQDWLNNYIFPAEDRLDSRAVRAGTALALAELIASGCTCVNDMYYFCEDIVHEIVQAGLSANINRAVTCFDPDVKPEDFSSCAEMRRLVEQWHGYGDGQILVDASIHGEYTSFLNPGMWDYLAQYAAGHNLGMHVHLSETRLEHEECVARHGRTPAQELARHGVFDVRAMAAHCVWTTPEDWALMAEKGVTCVHNPVSNLKLGSGVANIPGMLAAGVNVALGTDGVSSNNSHDLFEEIKLAAILHNGVTLDPTAVTPLQALEMATVNGAKALGRHTGKVALGYTADLILVDFRRPSLTPCHDPVENLVFAARGGDVVMNMARGRVIYENGQFFTLDLDRIRREVVEYALPKLFG